MSINIDEIVNKIQTIQNYNCYNCKTKARIVNTYYHINEYRCNCYNYKLIISYNINVDDFQYKFNYKNITYRIYNSIFNKTYQIRNLSKNIFIEEIPLHQLIDLMQNNNLEQYCYLKTLI